MSDLRLTDNVEIKGDYVGIYLNDAALFNLSCSLKAVISEPCTIKFNNLEMQIIPYKRSGLAEMAKETLVLRLPLADIHSLASNLEEMSRMNPNGNAIPHIHLEPVYITATATVSDIVFELTETGTGVLLGTEVQ